VNAAGPARALIFDSIYDDYRGVIVYVRVVDGGTQKGNAHQADGNEKEYQITRFGQAHATTQGR